MSSTSPNKFNRVEIDDHPESFELLYNIKGDDFLIGKINELFNSDDYEKKQNFTTLLLILSKVKSIVDIDFDPSEFEIDDVSLKMEDMHFPKIVQTISRRTNANDCIKYFLYKRIIDKFHLVINRLIMQYKDEAKEGKPYNKKRVKTLRKIYDTDCRKLLKYKKKLLNTTFRSLIDEFQLYNYYDGIIKSEILASLVKRYMQNH